MDNFRISSLTSSSLMFGGPTSSETRPSTGGPTGSPGITGATGPQGVTGATGLATNTGPAGSAGLSGIPIAGVTGSVQYNNGGGALAANSGLVWNTTSKGLLIGYTSTGAPTGGVIIKGPVGIGTNSVASKAIVEVDCVTSAGTGFGLYIGGTALAHSGQAVYGDYNVAKLGSTTGATGGVTVYGKYIKVDCSRNEGKVAVGYGALIDVGATPHGTITKAIGLLVKTPTCAASNFCAYFDVLGIGTVPTTNHNDPGITLPNPSGGTSATLDTYEQGGVFGLTMKCASGTGGTTANCACTGTVLGDRVIIEFGPFSLTTSNATTVLHSTNSILGRWVPNTGSKVVPVLVQSNGVGRLGYVTILASGVIEMGYLGGGFPASQPNTGMSTTAVLICSLNN